MTKKHKESEHHDPKHVLDAKSEDSLVPSSDKFGTKPGEHYFNRLREVIFASPKSRFLTFVLLFALIGAGFLLRSFADTSNVTYANQTACIDIYAGNHKFVHSGTCSGPEINPAGLTNQTFTWCAVAGNPNAWVNDGACPAAPPPPPPTGNKTYSQSACIDPTVSNHQFLHSGGCTQNEHGVGGYVSQSFTWCAAAANANTWVNDGPCPSSPGGIDVSITASPNSIYAGQKTTLTWKIAGMVDKCQEVMGTGPSDSFWSQTLHSSSALTFAPPSTMGSYLYGIDCYRGTTKVSATPARVVVNPVGIKLKSYSQSACINPGNDQHYFYHPGECTAAEISQGYVSSDPFTWCATEASSANWQNDGPCPIDPPTPNLSGPTGDQPDDATPGDDNPDQDFGLQAASLGGATKRVLHVLYVVPSNYKSLGDNGQFNVKGQINTSIAAMNTWMKQQTGSKIFRFDTNSGAVDVTPIQLNETYGKIANSCSPLTKATKCTPGPQLMEADLNAQLANNIKNYPNKKYLVYYEGTYPNTSVCGVNMGRYSVHFLRAQGTCDDLATSSASPKMAEFSLIRNVIQNLGFVSNDGCSPPDYKAGGYVTGNNLDVMAATTYSSGNLSKVVLDPKHKDYFGNFGKPGATNAKCDLNKNPFLSLAKAIKIIDISTPQGSNKYTADIGVVGVNSGKPQTQNGNLKSQVKQFKQAGLYVNTSYNQAITCSNNSSSCPSYKAGQADATYDLKYVKAQGVTANQWWLDVEGYTKTSSGSFGCNSQKTGNPWTAQPAVVQAYLRGMVDQLTSSGIKTVGIYGSPSVEACITGNWQPNYPSWVAKFAAPPTKQTDLDEDCAQSLTKGSTWLVQYAQNNKVDVDVACNQSFYASL